MQEGWFSSFAHVLLSMDGFERIWRLTVGRIDKEIEEWTRERSGLVFLYVNNFEFQICNYRPLFGSHYLNTPSILQNKKCIVNVDNSKYTDESEKKCFLWSVRACLAAPQLKNKYVNYDRYNKKVKTYLPFLHLVNDKGITYPMTISQIPKFEKLNPNISFTIISYEDQNQADYNGGINEYAVDPSSQHKKGKDVYKEIRNNSALAYTSKEQKENHVDLLLVVDGVNSHFVWIKKIEHYLQNPTTQHRFICRQCIQGFTSEDQLEKHRIYCINQSAQITYFPEEPSFGFDKWMRTQKIGFRFYVDFEANLKPFNCGDPEILERRLVLEELDKVVRPHKDSNNETSSKTRKLDIHKPSGYTWYCVSYDKSVRYSNTYRASSESENVTERLVKEIVDCTAILKGNFEKWQFESSKNMVISPHDYQRMNKTSSCCFCKKSLKENPSKDKNYYNYWTGQNNKGDSRIVRHHDHLPPHKFIGLAHNHCNFQASVRCKFPVFFPNGGNYDFHFLVQSVGELKKSKVVGKVDVIASSSEKFMAVTINSDIVFLDSLRFTMSSLNKLVKNMAKSGTQDFNCVRDLFNSKYSHGDFNLLLKKGIYPYSFMDSVDKFKLTSLREKRDFYDKLRDTHIKDKHYDRAKEVWRSFNIQTMGEYHDLYVALDTALLADVMEKTRQVLYDSYELEMCHYYSLPMVAYDAVLKISGIRLDYINDPTMHLWLEQAIRGGYVGIGSQRTAQANNKYMGSLYNPEEASSHITYIDANNL